MSHPVTAAAFLGINTKLRELFALLEALRAIREPLSTPEGLRASLELVFRIAEFVGVDRTWTDRVRTILDNPRVFDIVLAVVRISTAWSMASRAPATWPKTRPPAAKRSKPQSSSTGFLLSYKSSRSSASSAASFDFQRRAGFAHQCIVRDPGGHSRPYMLSSPA